jgi:hypothetical protein
MKVVPRRNFALYLRWGGALLVTCAANAQQADFTGKYVLVGATGDLKMVGRRIKIQRAKQKAATRPPWVF